MGRHADYCPANYLDPGICDCQVGDDINLDESLFRTAAAIRAAEKEDE